MECRHHLPSGSATGGTGRRRFPQTPSAPARGHNAWLDWQTRIRHWPDRRRAIRALKRFCADCTRGLKALLALPISLLAGAIETAAPVQLRATDPAWLWAKRKAEKMTRGEKAAIRSTATPEAIQFWVVSLLVGEVRPTTTSRKPTKTTVATTNFESSKPIRNSVIVVAALAKRGQIEKTQTKGTKDVRVRISAERMISSR